MKTPELLHGLTPVAGFPDELDVRFVSQNRGDSFSDQRMIIRAQDANHSLRSPPRSQSLYRIPNLIVDSFDHLNIRYWRAPCRFGIRTDTVVPLPGWLTKSKSAPICDARSFMPINP